MIIGVGAILLTFPGARAAGASLLASAGLISIVAGLAAQSTLANVFAGHAARVQRCDPGRRRRHRRDAVGPHRGDHAHLRRRAPVGRPAHGAALDLLHDDAVPELDPHSTELLGAVEFDLDWRVSPTRCATSCTAAGAHRPVGRARRSPAGDGRRRRLRARPHPGDAPSMRRPSSTCAATSARRWSTGCSASPARSAAAHPHADGPARRTRRRAAGPRAAPASEGDPRSSARATSARALFTGPIQTVGHPARPRSGSATPGTAGGPVPAGTGPPVPMERSGHGWRDRTARSSSTTVPIATIVVDNPGHPRQGEPPVARSLPRGLDHAVAADDRTPHRTVEQ